MCGMTHKAKVSPHKAKVLMGYGFTCELIPPLPVEGDDGIDPYNSGLKISIDCI
jgi:hypothetical protein